MAAWRPELLSPATSLLWFVIHILPLPSLSFSVQSWAPQGLHTPPLRREAAPAWWQWGLEPADGTAFVWALLGPPALGQELSPQCSSVACSLQLNSSLYQLLPAAKEIFPANIFKKRQYKFYFRN